MLSQSLDWVVPLQTLKANTAGDDAAAEAGSNDVETVDGCWQSCVVKACATNSKDKVREGHWWS